MPGHTADMCFNYLLQAIPLYLLVYKKEKKADRPYFSMFLPVDRTFCFVLKKKKNRPNHCCGLALCTDENFLSQVSYPHKLHNHENGKVKHRYLYSIGAFRRGDKNPRSRV